MGGGRQRVASLCSVPRSGPPSWGANVVVLGGVKTSLHGDTYNLLRQVRKFGEAPMLAGIRSPLTESLLSSVHTCAGHRECPESATAVPLAIGVHSPLTTSLQDEGSASCAVAARSTGSCEARQVSVNPLGHCLVTPQRHFVGPMQWVLNIGLSFSPSCL